MQHDYLEISPRSVLIFRNLSARPLLAFSPSVTSKHFNNRLNRRLLWISKLYPPGAGGRSWDD